MTLWNTLSNFLLSDCKTLVPDIVFLASADEEPGSMVKIQVQIAMTRAGSRAVRGSPTSLTAALHPNTQTFSGMADVPHVGNCNFLI